MIPLLLLAFGHWSSCAPVYIPRYGTHKYYEQPVCSYRWVDAPQLPDTKLQSPQIWLDIAAQWTVNPQDLKSGDWYVVAGPDRFAPLSQCYIPGEAHNELDVPCVRVDQ